MQQSLTVVDQKKKSIQHNLDINSKFFLVKVPHIATMTVYHDNDDDRGASPSPGIPPCPVREF